MPDVIFPEYRDQHATVKYPFSDTASLASQTPGLSLTTDTFVDASLYPIGAGPRVRISEIEVIAEPRQVKIWIGDATTARLASASFDPFDTPELLQVVDIYGRPAGVLVGEPFKLGDLGSWPTGSTLFAVGAAEFVATAVIPMPAVGLRGFITEAGDVLAGDVWIVGENGVVVRAVDDTIRIDIVGDPLFRRELCQPAELFVSQNYLQTINGCGPDEHGNFMIQTGGHSNAQTVLRVVTTGGRLRFEIVGKRIGEG